ncbi:MAG: restriction endonuclease subunit S [Gallionella sp.]|nr:restriction endonuclease subunit S [Gallionella sp.]
MSLMGPLAIRLSGQTTPAKSLVMPRYSEYKASGVEWLGEVPEHWAVKPIKAVSTCNDAVLEESTLPDYEIEYIEISGVDASRGISETTVIPFGNAPSRARRRVADGDVLVSTVRTYLRAIAPVTNPPTNMIASTGFAVIRPRHIEPSFLGFMFQAEFLIAEIIARSVGVSYPAINASDLMRLDIPIPTREEQQTIAAFLDRETGKIDTLIAEQRRLVELLAEKRQAVISHAVTKGLPSTSSGLNVTMKDSGIEWLGEVPWHWEVKRLRFVAELNPSKSEVATLDKETLVSFLPMDAIGDDGRLNLEREKPISEVETGYTFFRDGDVTVAKITPCFENGKGAVMRGLTQGIGFGTTELIVARPIASQVSSDYLHNLFTSVVFRKNGEGHMYGAGGQKRVPDDFVRDFEIAFPPLKEQQTIASFLDSEIAKFDTLSTEANRAIELLQERRSALISAAVTGKIDVRCNTFESGAHDAVATLS